MSSTPFRAVVLVVGGTLLVADAAAARKFAPCLPKRFAVTAPASVVTIPGALVTSAEIVTYDAPTGRTGKTFVSLASCVPTRGRVKGTARGTRVTAVFPSGSCPGIRGPLRLQALIDAGCNQWSGFLKFAKKPRTAFNATLSTCHDGRWDPGMEDCDADHRGRCALAQACRDDCRCQSTTTTTRTTTTGTTGPATSSTTTTLEPPECGDGFKQGDEECDGADLGGIKCPPGSRPGGVMRCYEDCTLDPSDCDTTTTTSTTTSTSTSTTTTTTSSSSTTGTTLPPICAYEALEFTVEAGAATCGRDASPAPGSVGGALLFDDQTGVTLGSGCLYLGAGDRQGTAPASFAAGTTLRLAASCDQNGSVLLFASVADDPTQCSRGFAATRHCLDAAAGTDGVGACTTDGDCDGATGACGPDARCGFGPPIAVDVSPVPLCLATVYATDAAGALDPSTGATDIVLDLATRLYAQPPTLRCHDGAPGRASSPGACDGDADCGGAGGTCRLAAACPACIDGRCIGGARHGLACTAVGSTGATFDCPLAIGIDATYAGTLPLPLGPLATGQNNRLADAAGRFCPDQIVPGAFGFTPPGAARASSISAGGSSPATCVISDPTPDGSRPRSASRRPGALPTLRLPFLVPACSRYPARSGSSPSQATMPFADVPGARLYYEIHGSGPWLVLVHGAGGSHLSWWQQVPHFAPTHRCLILDQRGFGRSSCDGPPDPTRFAGDLLMLLDHVGATDVALVGQSMGGWSVLGCALAAPERVRALVLTGTLAGLTDDAMLLRLMEHHRDRPPRDWRAALAADFPEREPVKTFLYEEIAAQNPPAESDFLRALMALRHAPDAARLRMPVLVIAGARDQLFPLELVQAAHAKLPGAELVVIPGAGHSAYFECPDEFNRALATFLAQ